ncbi:MAG: DUF1150 family protein [Rhodovibrionaceae bacterium]
MNTSVNQRHRMSSQDFLAFGIQDIAYVKALDGEQRGTFGIFAADGTRMAVMANEDVAFAAVRQHDLQPQRLH